MNKGFTLIELLVVISMLVILMVTSFLVVKGKKTRDCSEYANYEVDSIPVRCFDYWQIGKIK